MNKAEFLAGLRDALAGKLPSGELEDVLSYYEEYFADAGEEHEAEAAEGLGSPASVAAQVLEGRTGQAPSAASAERRPRRLWPVVLGICAAALLLLGVGIRLVFLAQRMPDAPAAGERQPVAAGQEPVVVEQDPVSTPPENKLELEPFTALDIDVGIGDIRMEEGDGWYLSLTSGGQDGDGTPYRLNHSQSGDTLEIWSTPENISGDGSPKGEVVLTVPEGTVLNRAEISIGVGALDWSGCAVEGLLRAESGVGGLDVTAPVGEAELISGVGDVALRAAGSGADYAYQLTTGTGELLRVRRRGGQGADSLQRHGGRAPGLYRRIALSWNFNVFYGCGLRKTCYDLSRLEREDGAYDTRGVSGPVAGPAHGADAARRAGAHSGLLYGIL